MPAQPTPVGQSSHVSSKPSAKAELSETPQFFLPITECLHDRVTRFSSINGMIRGFTRKHNFSGKLDACHFQVNVPEGLYIRAYSQIVSQDCVFCDSYTVMTAGNNKNLQPVYGKWSCGKFRDESKSSLLLTPGNVMFIKVQGTTVSHDFWLYFEGIHEKLRESLNVVYTSKTAGYITPHGFDQHLQYAWGLNISHILHLPQEHVVMVSFPYFKMHRCRSQFLELFLVGRNGKWTKLWRNCKENVIDTSIHHDSLGFRFITGFSPSTPGFKCLFSFHLTTEAPNKSSSGLFNCSRHYDTFRQHLDCNLRVECQNQEDEADGCSFYNAHCNGSVFIQVRIPRMQ